VAGKVYNFNWLWNQRAAGELTMDFIVREAQPDDAEQIINYIQDIAAEPGIAIVLEPGEFKLTVDQERQYLADRAAEDNSLFLVAEAMAQVIAVLNLRGGARRALRHEAVLGITVAKNWRGHGVGDALMTRAIEWARQSGVITRVELQVFTSNITAIHLYQKHGFEIEGRRRRATFREGKYHDDYIMALLL
jgi:RimJ/RimL family protein N-acetyltransferase